MRVVAGLFSVLCLGVLSQALATEPKPASASSPPAPAAAEPQTATAAPASAEQPSAAKSASDSTPAATAAAKPDAGKTELTAADHELMSQGYKLEMRHGEKYFCRRETIMGSHFEQKTCNTAASIEAQTASSQELVRRMQVYSPKVNN
jgi:hypothetical protein